MPKENIHFELTRNQHEALSPFREMAYDGWYQKEKGAILMQPVSWPDGHMVKVGFVPHKYAKRINDILFELMEEEERDDA